jgi:hypothetical protein
MIPDNNKKKKSPLGDGPKLPKFNIYWIYGLIAISLLSARFFQTAPDVNTISQQEFVKLMTSGDIEKYVKVTNKKVVRIYIKVDSITKEFYVQKFGNKLTKEKAKGNYLFEYEIDGIDNIYIGNINTSGSVARTFSISGSLYLTGFSNLISATTTTNLSWTTNNYILQFINRRRGCKILKVPIY